MNEMLDIAATNIGKTSAVFIATLVGVASPVLIAAQANMSVMSPEGWAQLAVQGAMTFVFAIFLLWVWPQQNKFQRDMAKDMQDSVTNNNAANAKALQSTHEANAQVVKTLTQAFERHDVAWRQFISRHGYCPVRDGDSRNHPETTVVVNQQPPADK